MIMLDARSDIRNPVVHRAVFYDPTHRRWRGFLTFVGTGMTILIFLGVILLSSILQSPQLPQLPDRSALVPALDNNGRATARAPEVAAFEIETDNGLEVETTLDDRLLPAIADIDGAMRDNEMPHGELEQVEPMASALVTETANALEDPDADVVSQPSLVSRNAGSVVYLKLR